MQLSRSKVGKRRFYKKAPPHTIFIALKNVSCYFTTLAILTSSLAMIAFSLSLPNLNLKQIYTLPDIIERRTFAIFDWGETELNKFNYSFQDLGGAIALAKEAGQSAIQTEDGWTDLPTYEWAEESIINHDQREVKTFKIEIPKLELLEKVTLNIDH